MMLSLRTPPFSRRGMSSSSIVVRSYWKGIRHSCISSLGAAMSISLTQLSIASRVTCGKLSISRSGYSHNPRKMRTILSLLSAILTSVIRLKATPRCLFDSRFITHTPQNKNVNLLPNKFIFVADRFIRPTYIFGNVFGQPKDKDFQDGLRC